MIRGDGGADADECPSLIYGLKAPEAGSKLPEWEWKAGHSVLQVEAALALAKMLPALTEDHLGSSNEHKAKRCLEIAVVHFVDYSHSHWMVHFGWHTDLYCHDHFVRQTVPALGEGLEDEEEQC